jgi:alanine racemase
MPADAWGGRPCWAEIDLDAIAHNVRLIAGRAAPAQVFAVVKANAYGHGAVGVGRAALEAGAHGLAVVCVDEADELRRAGIDAPVLVVGTLQDAEAEAAVELRVTPTVTSMPLAQALARHAAARNVTQRIHVELESGLNRNGLPAEELVAFAESCRALPNIEVEGLYTHFAAAEEGDHGFTRAQYDALVAVSKQLDWIPVRHCAASASALLTPEFGMDAVRAGLAVYGYHPAQDQNFGVDLRPALTLKSSVARVVDVAPGGTVGYGRTWKAKHPSRIALIMCGYADGLRRSLSNRGCVLIRGRRAPIAGRIAMDMCMADVTDIAGVAAGDEAVIIGAQDGERVDADEIAALADTISWEILAGVSARVPRLYLRDGVAREYTTLNERLPRPMPAQAAPVH